MLPNKLRRKMYDYTMRKTCHQWSASFFTPCLLDATTHFTSSPDGAGGIFSCVLVSSPGFDVVVLRFLCGLYELLICYEIIFLSTSIFHSTLLAFLLLLPLSSVNMPPYTASKSEDRNAESLGNGRSRTTIERIANASNALVNPDLDSSPCLVRRRSAHRTRSNSPCSPALAAVEVGLPSDALIGIHSMIGKLYLCIVVSKTN